MCESICCESVAPAQPTASQRLEPTMYDPGVDTSGSMTSLRDQLAGVAVGAVGPFEVSVQVKPAE